MKRYSKPLGRLMEFKQDFFEQNRGKLDELSDIAALYAAQPRRTQCKNCEAPISPDASPAFRKLGVEYYFCQRCGHCNGAHEDTAAFARNVYTDDAGASYAKSYTAADVEQYRARVAEVYRPKVDFLKAALADRNEPMPHLADFGAGAGYFVSAALDGGFSDTVGYEPSETLVKFGNAMLQRDCLVCQDLDQIVPRIEQTDASIVSFIGVIEHLTEPRSVLQAIARNDSIRYLYFSVPLFSPTVALECVFPHVMPRHLAGGHTHLYTEQSIQYFCDEFGLQRLSEWWFGLDICDLSRSVSVSMMKDGDGSSQLQTYWNTQFSPLIDELQAVLDRARVCSEVHMLVGKPS